MLASFRDSGNDKEQQVFSCMVHNLFDEYQFFTKYPDKVRTARCVNVIYGTLFCQPPNVSNFVNIAHRTAVF